MPCVRGAKEGCLRCGVQQDPDALPDMQGHRTARSGQMIDVSKVLVRHILENAQSFEWSLQGMGMLRLHLPNNNRLQVWDSRFRAPGVSMVHDHLQWGLHSWILAGRLTNRKYVEVTEPDKGHPFKVVTIKPGVGTFFKEEPRNTYLKALKPELYVSGACYHQHPSEIHETDALDGTVTLIFKEVTPDESARVFWPLGTEWGSAEPHSATPAEVEAITQNSLDTWFRKG